VDAASTHERFFGWIERQIARLEPAPVREAEPERAPAVEQDFDR
jgi:hypothetical protein